MPNTNSSGSDTNGEPKPANIGDNETNLTTVNRVSVKVPPFWDENPKIWFAQVEAQFANSGVHSDVSKFNTVVAAIETRILAQVSDAILSPPPDGKYVYFKKVLLERFGASEQENIRRLISHIELGDKKPSQLLQEMTQLGGGHLTDDFMQTLWLNRLPANTRAILQASTADLRGKAALADKILEVSDHYQVDMATSTTASAPTSAIERRIEQIDRQLQQLLRRDRRDRSTHRAVSRNRKRDRTPATNTTDLCWYHRKFGEDARKCRSPCTFLSKNH